MFALKLKKKRSYPEQDLCIQLAKTISEMKAYGIIQSDFMLIRLTTGSSIGEYKKRRLSGAIEKAMGAIDGASDYICVWRDRLTQQPKILFLEMKVKGNYLQENQKEFERKVKNAGGPFEVARSTDEVLQILKKHGVFLKQIG